MAGTAGAHSRALKRRVAPIAYLPSWLQAWGTFAEVLSGVSPRLAPHLWSFIVRCALTRTRGCSTTCSFALLVSDRHRACRVVPLRRHHPVPASLLRMWGELTPRPGSPGRSPRRPSYARNKATLPKLALMHLASCGILQAASLSFKLSAPANAIPISTGTYGTGMPAVFSSPRLPPDAGLPWATPLTVTHEHTRRVPLHTHAPTMFCVFSCTTTVVCISHTFNTTTSWCNMAHPHSLNTQVSLS